MRAYNSPVLSPDRIRDDLRGEFRGRLFTDLPHRAVYAADASPFHLLPHAVAIPDDEGDLRVLVRYAHEHSLPLVPRGAGTGFSGESLGAGVVVDLSVGFRRPPTVHPESLTAECGLTLAEVNAALAPHGRRFAPGVLSAHTATVGGVVGTDASGPNVAAVGYTRDHVRGLRVVWDDGETATLTACRQQAAAADTPQLRTIELGGQVKALLTKHAPLIERHRPLTPFHRGPYRLDGVLTAAGLDLARLLVGSEGTLAFTTAAELATVPLPGGVAVGVGGFRTLNDALRAGLLLRSVPGVVSADVFDQRAVSLAKPTPGVLFPDGVAAAIVVEVEADTFLRADAILEVTAERMRQVIPLVRMTGDPAAAAAFRRRVCTATYSTAGGVRPVPLIDDTAVPGEELVRYVSGLTDLLRKAELPAVFHVNPLAGQVVVRPLLDLATPAARDILWPLADKVNTLAAAVGGSVSTRFGVGLARTPWMNAQAGPLLPVFAEVKRIFDPAGVLNPGKITAPDPSRPAWPLREPPARRPLEVRADAPEERCTGCGDCRTRTPPARMCPTFHPAGVETASPRAKAVLMARLRDTPAADVPPEDARAVADWCVHCKQCVAECPSGVDASRLALEVKAELHAAHGFTRDEWVRARLGGLARLAGGVPLLANPVLGSRLGRWAAEKLLGLSRGRTLPRFTLRPFLSRRGKLGVTDRTPAPPPADGPLSAVRVAYLVDLHTDRFDPLTGEAVVAVLRHHGIPVYVPPRQSGVGTAALREGDFDAARGQAARVVREFADLIREGFTVVASDPITATTVAQDYPLLLDDDDTRLLAAGVQEFSHFLGGLYARGWFRTDFQRPLPVRVGHHVPCHVKAMGGEPAAPTLLQLIPKLELTTADVSCSGMAGGYGLRADAYERSLAIGRPTFDLLNAAGVQYTSSECGACRMQLQEGTGRRATHPAQLLALAYGLLPQVEKKLNRPLRKRLTD